VKLFGESDEVDGLLALAEGDHLGEDAAVLIEEKIFGLKIFDGGVEGVVIEEDGTEDRALRVEVIGEGLFESGVHVHRSARLRFLFAYDSIRLFVGTTVIVSASAERPGSRLETRSKLPRLADKRSWPSGWREKTPARGKHAGLDQSLVKQWAHCDGNEEEGQSEWM
jgi:hypothetical protein